VVGWVTLTVWLILVPDLLVRVERFSFLQAALCSKVNKAPLQINSNKGAGADNSELQILERAATSVAKNRDRVI